MTTSIIKAQVEKFVSDEDARRKRTADTTAQYKRVLERKFLPWCSEAGIDDAHHVLDDKMDQYTAYLYRNGKNLSDDSVAAYLRPVRAFLNYYRVPRGDFRPPRRRKRLVEPLQPDEFMKLRDEASPGRDRLLLTVLWATGMRLNEVVELRTNDLLHADGRTQLRVGRKNQRFVPIPRSLFDDLERLSEVNGHQYLFASVRRSGATRESQPLDRNGAYRIIAEIVSRADLPRRSKRRGSRVNALLFRHSFAMRWMDSGGSVTKLAKVLGHNSLHEIVRYVERDDEDPYDQATQIFKKWGF